MRFLILLSAAAGAVVAAPLAAGQPTRASQDRMEAYRGVREGNILPLPTIRSRVQVPGARFIGADLIAGGTRYRLRFMRGSSVIFVDVDARTGQIVGQSGN